MQRGLRSCLPGTFLIHVASSAVDGGGESDCLFLNIFPIGAENSLSLYPRLGLAICHVIRDMNLHRNARVSPT